MASPPGHTAQDIQNHLYNALLSRATTDVCLHVRAVGWQVAYNLHKVILIQSGFFSSLFTRGFRESARATTHEGDETIINVQFDDPNITRAAFEICITRLYGGGAPLYLSPDLMPTPSQPLTAHRLVPPTYTSPPPGHHPATPRFLLSLIATSFYLSIPSVTSQAVAMVLSSVGPSTVIRYLNFARGVGIGDVDAGDENCAVGFENVGKDLVDGFQRLAASGSEGGHSDGTEGEHPGGRKHGCEGSQIGGNEPVSLAENVPPRSQEPLFHYGAVGNKIGEACACWLARWSTDIFPYEERHHYSAGQYRSTGTSKLVTSKNVAGPSTLGHNRASSHPPRPFKSRINPLFGQSQGPALVRRATLSDIEPAVEKSTPDDAWGHGLSPDVKPSPIWSSFGGLPANWIRALLSSNDLFISGGEKDRYDFATRVIEMRRRERRGISGMTTVEEGEELWEDEDEIEWQVLFETGVYYSHMTFDELLKVQEDVSPTTGRPFVPLSILQSAHWNQSIFRGHLTPSNLSASSSHAADAGSSAAKPAATRNTGGQPLTTLQISTMTAFAGGYPRTFFPVFTDGSQKVGGDIPREAIEAITSSSSIETPGFILTNPSLVRHSIDESRFFGLTLGARSPVTSIATQGSNESATWMEIEPARFSVEFWGVDVLKPSQRLYSKTFWRFGSLWNVYVQVVKKKGVQLGVYLQRQSFVDSIPSYSVPRNSVSSQMPLSAPNSSLSGLALHHSASVPSIPALLRTPSPPPTPSALSRTRPWSVSNHAASTTNFFPIRTPTPAGSPLAGRNPMSNDTAAAQNVSTLDDTPRTVPAIVPSTPYRDPRQSIRAYFSISCPSATGASLTKFSSAPDIFNVTQSWGWKTSKAEEWVEFVDNEGGIKANANLHSECSLRAVIILGVL